MSSLKILALLVIVMHSASECRPLFDEESDEFLAIACDADPLFSTLSPECVEYFEKTATTSTIRPNITPKEVAVVADWVKILLGLTSSLFSIYTALVSFYHFYKKLGFKQALLLGLGPGRRDQADMQESHEMPVLVSTV